MNTRIPLFNLVTCVLMAATTERSMLNAENAQVNRPSPSPFGVVCPWPGVSKAGIKWCRVGAGATPLTDWPGIEKERGKFDWSAADGELKSFDDPEGLSLLPILGYTPQWASRSPGEKDFQFYPPKDIRDFSRFVHACVGRYKHRVRVWEVWNEPNIGFFRGSVADYAEMVKAACVAAKQADPSCRVAIGCAGVDVDFLRRLYEFGCGPFFDVMSVHPYQWGAQLNDGWMIDKLEACRKLMDDYGDPHKEIWLTELGWSLSEGVTAEQQANLLVQAMVTALTVRERLKVEKSFWFCVKDWGGPGHGLFDVDGKPKPSFVAYRVLIGALEGARYVGLWKVSDKARAHLFEREGKPVLVLWNPSPTATERIELKTEAASVSARAVSDEIRELRSVQGKVLLEVSHSPLFITGFKTNEIDVLRERKASPVTSKSLTKPRGKDAACAAKGVWLSVTPPSSTIRPYFVLDAFNTFLVRIHNDSGKLAQGDVVLELRRKNHVLSAGRLPFQVRPGEIDTVVWQTTLPPIPELAGELATLTVRGSAAKESLAPIELPVRLSRGRTIEFLANSFTEGQHLHDGSKSGCSDSIRFGNEFSYKFDLRDCKWAQLRLLVGAHNAQEWHVSLSVDEKTWSEVAAEHNWPSWHVVDLDKFLPQPDEGPRTSLFVKIHGNDCQLREVILETEQSFRPKQVHIYQRSPTELIVWDTRPELGMGMHQMPDDQIALVRRLGVRFVRHTMYWGAVENTATEGTYDEKQLRQWDDLVARCERQGIILVVVVHSNPPGVSWANREEGYRRFARFMTDMAKRYPQVRYWELWNEMDAGFTDLFGAGRDEVSLLQRGRLYAEMLKMAYPAIKKANPDSWVLTGGMTDWSEFPRGLYEGGGRDYFDLMNIHTYGVPISWAFSARGQKLRAVMQEFDDGEKPLWNTEFGIDAGNFVGAWGYPHSWNPPQKDDEFFDTEQRKQWEACLRKNAELGLYAKVLPYQFVAGNERDDDRHIKERAQLPPGMTIDDYGFGILRSDGKTPRPTYNWLLEQRINRPIEQLPSVKTEVRCRPKVKAVPVGYKYGWEGDELIIKDVKVDSAFPTRIILRETGAK